MSDDAVQFSTTMVFNSERPRCSTSPPYSSSEVTIRAQLSSDSDVEASRHGYADPGTHEQTKTVGKLGAFAIDSTVLSTRTVLPTTDTRID